MRHTPIVAEIKLDSPLQYVKGVGPRKAEALANHGLISVRDLLYYLPRNYLDRTTVLPISQLRVDQSATIIGEVKAHGVLYGRRKRYEVILQDDSGPISLLFFQVNRFMQSRFEKGQVYAATGTVSYFQGYQIIHPDLERLDEGSDRMVHAGRIIPVYPQTSELNRIGLNSKGIRRITTYVFENLVETTEDDLPGQECATLALPPLHEALRSLHYPDSREQIEHGRRRLAFDELLQFQYLVMRNKHQKQTTKKSHSYRKPGPMFARFKESLPFELTNGQRKSANDIFHDLQTERPMSRMLQGDVGCGKTVVAVAAAAYAAENDLQVAFMAPTEILAEQHFRNWKRALESLGMRCALLTASLPAAKKKSIGQACASGEVQILFGTHAMMYDYVTFKCLALVIIDEQHRFGVEQRARLYAKGENPDLLVMTATPIPRTLALTLYGDLDISTIDELPPGRLPVRTVWRSGETRDKVYQFVRSELEKKRQAYIVFPLIEKSDQIELRSVEEEYGHLVRDFFEGIPTGIVHGRVKSAERNKLLEEFHDGRIAVLFSTTVIEVGLDNPNATIMVIEHAERFGLATLHQLRGRIGRGDKQSTLVAIAYTPIADYARQRLDCFVSTNDGFRIAEADLELRGPGEMFGVRQSGMPELRAVRLSSDYDLIKGARILLQKLFEGDNRLDTEYRNLYSSLRSTAGVGHPRLGGG